MAVSYNEWIGRERRIRLKILKGSLVVREKGLYRVCQARGVQIVIVQISWSRR
jgi:hypothetical protein